MSPFWLVILLMMTDFLAVEPCLISTNTRSFRRKVTPLVLSEKKPDIAETSPNASGPLLGRITRNSSKFSELFIATHNSSDIHFKDEEGTGIDRVMSKNCYDKLSSLSKSVVQYWGGKVSVRVIDAWKDQATPGDSKLHMEGRALDIQTTDRDRTKLGILADLAYKAGFNWVYYVSRSYIHCSVKSDTYRNSNTGCFSSKSTVITATGEKKLIGDLQIGEKVMSVDEYDNIVYSEVFMFLDREDDENREFVRLKTEDGSTLTVTPAHLLMLWKPQDHNVKYTFADKVAEGDYLLVNVDGVLKPRKVVWLEVAYEKGYYAPLTKTGTIIVDSVAASCYALVDSQSIAHWSFLPIRWVDTISHLFQSRDQLLTKSNQHGIHWYAKILYSMKDYVLPTNWIYR